MGFEPTANGTKPSLYPAELACGGNCLASSRYTHSRLLPGECAPAGCSKPDRCENSRQRPPDGASQTRRTECVEPEKLKAPNQRQLTGASCESLAESCLYAALRCIEELVQIVRIPFVATRARGDAEPIRQNRLLRRRGKHCAGKRVLVVRMHRGAHSRRETSAVKREMQMDRERGLPCTWSCPMGGGSETDRGPSPFARKRGMSPFIGSSQPKLILASRFERESALESASSSSIRFCL